LLWPMSSPQRMRMLGFPLGMGGLTLRVKAGGSEAGTGAGIVAFFPGLPEKSHWSSISILNTTGPG
jgi:hypothetical protein